jgi:hypothetical protein
MLHKKLIVAHLVKKLPSFVEFGILKPILQNPQLDSIQRKQNPTFTGTPSQLGLL